MDEDGLLTFSAHSDEAGHVVCTSAESLHLDQHRQVTDIPVALVLENQILFPCMEHLERLELCSSLKESQPRMSTCSTLCSLMAQG